MENKIKLETRGGVGKRKNFSWWYNEESGVLNIESEEGLFHRYHQDEILQILSAIKSKFGKSFFPLANNVEKLSNGTEKSGLGTVILDHSPKKVSHAQGASYLGPVLEQIGYFQWNGKNRGIQWRLVNHNITKKAVIEGLKYPVVQTRPLDSLMTVNELARKLKVPKSWIYTRTRESGPDAMPKIHVGRYLRFIWNDVWDWIQKNQKK